MKILVIDQIGLALDFCMQCEESGHDVRLWVKPKKGKTRNAVGDGFVRKVPDWKPHMAWADLIVTTDNSSMMEELAPFQKRGFPIFGSNMAGAELELNRQKGQDLFKKVGMKVMEGVEFKDYDKAIEYVKKNMERFVSKPNGDVDKALSYVSKSPADMVFMLERWKEKNPKNEGFILQKFQGGIEMAVGGWFGKNGWSRHFLENFEHKKLMAGDNGVNCYSADSEVLTDSGWKFWPEVTFADKICTLIDGRIEFEVPSKLIRAPHNGVMLGWQSASVDILVTPGHRMYVQDAHGRKPFFFEPSDVTAQHRRKIMRGGGRWEGISAELPAWCESNAEDFAALIGAYIADGNCRDRSIVFGNCPEHKQVIFSGIAEQAGFAARLYGKDLYINSKALADYCRPFGLAEDKRVPEFVRQGTCSVIESFLRGYGAGDGSENGRGYTIFTTISRRLADDVQELLLKLGRYGSINVRDRRGESPVVNGVECVNRQVSYDVCENKARLKANLTPEILEIQEYSGEVYCCEVTSHVIYVRRNGKACWLGQTGEQGTCMRYTEKSQLAEELLLPLTDHLKKINYRGFFDMACIIDKDGTPWPLEATSRPGWPCNIIQSALIVSDPAEWMLDSLEGRDTLQVANEVATGVVVAIPDYPFTEYTGRDVEGFPVYHSEPMWMEDIHLCDVKLGKAPVEEDGEIVEKPMPVTTGDYVCVATGTDFTVSGSANRAYRAIKKIEIPNSPMWRIDIGKRLEKQLPELQDLGYAEGWEY